MKYLRALPAVLAVAVLCYVQFLDAVLRVRDLRADASSGDPQGVAYLVGSVT